MCDDVRAGVLCFGMCFGFCSHSSSCWLRRFMLSLRSRAALPWVLSRVTPHTSQRNTSHIKPHTSNAQHHACTHHTSRVTSHLRTHCLHPRLLPLQTIRQPADGIGGGGRHVCGGARHMSHGTEENVMRHTSHVTRHTLHVTRHTSHVT